MSTNNNTNSNQLNNTIRIFEVLIRTEQDQQKKNKVIQVLQRIKQFSKPSLFRQLDPQSIRKLMQIKTMIKIYRNAFEKITDSKPQYRKFAMDKQKIQDVIFSIQQKIQTKDYRTSYYRALTYKKKDFGWTKQFLNDWSKQVQIEREIQQKNLKQRNLQKQNSIKNQQSSRVSNTQNRNLTQQSVTPPQTLKVEQKPQVIKQTQKPVQKLPGEKPQKKLKKDQNAAQKPEKQKKVAKPKKQIEQSESQQNEAAKQALKKKIEKENRQRLQQRYNQPRDPKNRVKSLMQYLQNRKQFSSLASNPSKSEEIAQFLNQKLEKFMKHHLSNLIQIAKLRNRKHQTLISSGNQFTYFSRQGYTSTKPINHLQVSQQPARMLKLNYRSKFQLYSLLRYRQQVLEQQLQRQFASKRDQETINRSDKKLWEYLLRPNQMIQKTENFIEMEDNKTDRLSIEITHIRYLFQSHKFISNSWLMMYCYNS